MKYANEIKEESNIMQNVISDLLDIEQRLILDFNDGVKFEAEEQDRLTIGHILDFVDTGDDEVVVKINKSLLYNIIVNEIKPITADKDKQKMFEEMLMRHIENGNLNFANIGYDMFDYDILGDYVVIDETAEEYNEVKTFYDENGFGECSLGCIESEYNGKFLISV